MCILLLPWAVAAQDQTDEGRNALAGLDSSFELQTGEYQYLPENRRDPFRSLLAGKGVKGNREAIEGIGGLLIDELDLEGVIFNNGVYKALLKGPDRRPYVVLVGEKVYDGEIIAIDSYTVKFKKIFTVALGGQKEKIIIKTLNPEEEEKEQDEQTQE